MPDPATVTVPVVVIGPPVAIPEVLTCVTVPAPPPLLPGTVSMGTTYCLFAMTVSRYCVCKNVRIAVPPAVTP